MPPSAWNEKAIQVITEAIDIFQQLGDEVKVADCTITKGVAFGTACPEHIKTYLEAEEILLRVTGLLHISVDRLYLNLGIAYEETGDLHAAYRSFYKWFEVCKDLYGLGHTKTRRPISTLNEFNYKRIAEELGNEIPVQ
jgi:tetratricopeptide (TPR) repeat protein